jgi:xanthine dehydrogenase molybdenum-binding subunit
MMCDCQKADKQSDVMKQTFKVLGKGYPRHEAEDKVRGKAVYTDDLECPGMVYGAILRSPYPRAKVVAIDTSEAGSLPGVMGILLPEDVPQKPYNCSGNPPSPLAIQDEKILTDHPLHVGDRIAAVAATSYALCQMALSLISVQYEPLTPVLDLEQAIREDSPVLHPEISPNNIFNKIEADQGDVEQGFNASDLVLEDVFETPGIFHACMETVACICDFTGGKDLVVWSNSQTPFQERRILSKILKLPESRVRVIKPMMGGGFGSRQQLHNQVVGALLSGLVKRPVKIINTREEEMVGTCVRHASRCRVKMGVSKEGGIRAIQAEVHHNCGPYATHSPIVLAAQSRKVPYRLPHYRYEGYCVYTDYPVAGAMRGYGNPQLSFAREVLLDRAAKQLNMDPVEIRMKNRILPGDTVPGSPLVLQSCAIKACIEAGEAIRNRIDLEITADSETRDEEIVERWGMALAMHTSGASNNTGMSSAVIMIHDDGSATLLTGSADMGQGSETALSQIVAEVLGLELADVKVTAADTLHTPYETGSFASSQAYVAGHAVNEAAKDVIDRTGVSLAVKYGMDVDLIVFENHRFCFDKGGKTISLSFKEAISDVHFGETGTVITGRASFKASHSAPPFSACWAKVAYDRLTNSICVRHVIEVADVGTPINRDIVIGQIEGGIAMGLGYALMEDLEMDGRVSKPVTNDLLSCKVPSAMDMPEIHTHIVESYEPSGPLGVKSVGEMTVIPVAPAIVNAVVAATGEDISRLPLSRYFNIRRPF